MAKCLCWTVHDSRWAHGYNPEQSMNTVTTAPARLRVTHAECDGPLIRFQFDAAADDPLHIPCAHLAGPGLGEFWCAGPISESAETCGAVWAHGDEYAMVAVSVAEDSAGDIEHAAQFAYERLITCVRPSRHPYLLRIWNYFSAINAGQGDGERYRRFCVGRALGVDGRFNDPPPAATAIGSTQASGRLQVIALCARAPAIALENPRQTPAWRYPREFGPVSPGFSRGALLDAGTDTPRLLASGTASIVGHVSQHVDDVGAQLVESLANLEALLAAGTAHAGRTFSLRGCEALRVYLRHPEHLALAQRVILASSLPSERVIYLHGEVCRQELAVELEGVFVAGD
jgi:chorismate lyase/3-hydroxybenzoate synthase